MFLIEGGYHLLLLFSSFFLTINNDFLVCFDNSVWLVGILMARWMGCYTGRDTRLNTPYYSDTDGVSDSRSDPDGYEIQILDSG